MLKLSTLLLIAIALAAFTAAYTAVPEQASFISRKGSQLMNGEKPFRFAGMNIHWLGMDDPGEGSYPSFQRIDEAFEMAAAMHATVVRSHTLGISVGCKNCLEPALHQWNDTAFKTIDYALASAHKHNIRLIIPLADNWHYYHGGKHTFAEWRGHKNEDDFYADATVIADFKEYIAHLLNHRNEITGLALKDDPAIMAWETGNELTNTSSLWNDNWTEDIAHYIKSLAPRQLVLDGHTSDYDAPHNITQSQLALPDVDMYTGHFYPPRVAFMQKDAELTAAAGKVYFVGEYDWSDQDAAPASGSISQDGSTKTDGQFSARINVSKSNTNGYYVQLGQGDLTLKEGQTYEIAFSAKASKKHHINVLLQQEGHPYTVYFRQLLALGTDWNRYYYTYTAEKLPEGINLWFNVAEDDGDIWIDDVSVRTGGGPNLLRNPSFEEDEKNWQSPWYFQVKPGGDTLADFLPVLEKTPRVSGDLFWQLYGHDDAGKQWQHGDKYTLHYPGATPDMTSRAAMLAAHAQRMNSGN